jgi:rapamycin-insensitive companion of mTOR
MTASDAHMASDPTLLQPVQQVRDGRSPSVASMFPPRNQSLAASSILPPGSFSSDLRTALLRGEVIRSDMSSHSSFVEHDARATSEKRQAELRGEIEKENKIKIGSENMLEALSSKNVKGGKEQRRKVEDALNNSNRKLLELKMEMEAEIQRTKTRPVDAGIPSVLREPNVQRFSQQGYPVQETEPDEEIESPTFVLSEILEALEMEGMKPSHYIDFLNKLVELFKRHPTLKDDLAWSLFGLRLQTMLLSESREVVAAGYRVLRYAITDRKSLQLKVSLVHSYTYWIRLTDEVSSGLVWKPRFPCQPLEALLSVKPRMKRLTKPT